MDYKQIIYKNYLDNHTSGLYGSNSINKIEKRFTVWKYYYGKVLPPKKGVKILEIGCGDGGLVYWLQTLGYQDVHGIDISQAQIEEGQRMGIKGLECHDLSSYLTNKIGHYDLIIARDVMEHFTKQEVFQVLELIYKALKPQGNLLIQSPNGAGIFYSGMFYNDFTHEIAFTDKSLNQICKNAGFEAVKCWPVNPAPVTLFSAIRWLGWNFVVLGIRFVRFLETGNSSGIFTQNIIACVSKSHEINYVKNS